MGETDFETAAVALEEILMGGPPKDGIPAIDEPQFAPASSLDLGDNEAAHPPVSQGRNTRISTTHTDLARNRQ